MKHKYLVGAAVLCCIPYTAFAQDTANTTESEDAIIVTGQRAQQERSIEIKRDAIGVLDVAASDEIGQLPDRNVAEVVEHLPGVGVAYDQGEGRYVSVRGVPSALNGYTLDGLEIGNPDGNTRALPLDVVSGQLLNRVEIAKVKTADMDGQGIGGTLNLVTQTAFDYRDAFNVSVNAQAGYQELNKKVPVRGDASIAGRFGADEQFGVVLGVSYSNRDFVSEGFYPDDWRAVDGFARGGAPTNIKYTEYSLDRKRVGATGAFDWHPNDHQTFYVRGLYSKFIENEIRARYRLDFATQALVGDTLTDPEVNNPNFHLNPDGETGFVTGTPTPANGVGSGSGPERREDLRLDYKVKTVLTGIVGGSTELDRLKLEYMGARSHNEVLDRFPTWQFRCNPGTVDFDFSHTIYSATPRTECTANQMQFRSYLFHHEAGTEGIWQGRFDATYDLGGDSFLKAGVKYRTSDRDFDSSEDTWARGGSNATRFTMGQFGLDGPAVVVHPDNDDPSRGFVNGPTFNISALKDFTAQNIGGAFFVKDTPTSIANATLNDFDLTEDVAAAYAMANIKLGMVTVTPGVRFEHTSLHITGNQLQDGTTILPATRNSDYNDFLPTLIVRIEPSSQMVMRLAYSRSIGRPEYASLSPGGEITVDDGTQPGLQVVSVSFGNPDLKPFRSDNFDATAEWYFAKGGLLSFGAFAKFIKNPIFTQSYTLFNTTFNGQPYETASFSQPLNADKGKILGIEAQYQQQFDFLPGLLSGFGISLNATLTESNLDIPNGPKGTFPGQSDYLYGAKLFYQKGRVEASVAYHNTGKQLISAGLLDSGIQDQFNNDLRRLDAKASFKILPGARLFFEAQNLTDEPTRQYQSNNTDWLIQNERYGRTFYAGVSAKF
ncbi:TonB-dependent receptor [Sphingomonas sp. JC676]|uniref:TonB-dependent receptor n=1 Tax=Sphingomonas sp. JC676 TaxID=2768065 RepID=UPI00165779C5|nr:TonB-dependent receptor [Sphingomonas sp. JC676]MBC9034450.1 TonB-dependent receptor [Sphingomonas sp. JC676]